jgi:hypothetical protein
MAEIAETFNLERWKKQRTERKKKIERKRLKEKD